MSSTAKSGRPLSPHLSVYRWQYTMTLSILHRLTGVGLSVGLLLFTYWLVALVSGPESYASAWVVLAHPLARLVWVAFSFCFFYHLFNGVRHLTWDTGHGMERKSARLSGWLAFIGALLATALFWFLLMNRLAGSAA